jgi:hypothetical protein
MLSMSVFIQGRRHSRLEWCRECDERRLGLRVEGPLNLIFTDNLVLCVVKPSLRESFGIMSGFRLVSCTTLLAM